MLFVIALFHQCNSRLTAVGINMQHSFTIRSFAFEFFAYGPENTLITKTGRHLGLLRG